MVRYSAKIFGLALFLLGSNAFGQGVPGSGAPGVPIGAPTIIINSTPVVGGTNGNLLSISGSAVADSGVPSSALALGIYSATVNNPGSNAAIGDVLTPSGGTTQTIAGYLAAAKVVVVQAQLTVLPTVAAGGSTCTGTSGTLTGTTGTGTKFQVTATISGGVVTAITAITVAGNYSVLPTVPTA
jgi:hypothetical protein